MPVLQSHAAALRSLTAATLIAQNTIAGPRVEQERVVVIARGETPHLNVFMDESAEGQYQGAPRFLVTGKLQIKGTVQRATLTDARGDLDTLVEQVKDALFGEPAWLIAANQILSFSATATFKGQERQHDGEVLIQISCQWIETTIPRGAGALTGEDLTVNVGVPGITAPLIAVTNFPTS